MGKKTEKIDLLSYLPLFLREYDETKAALNAENPEFELLWDKAAKALEDNFILTAGEDGIRHFEKVLGILPEPGRDLETRRGIVLARWLSRLPYTYRMLLKELGLICGEDFEANGSFEEDYYLRVVSHMRDWTKTSEVKRLLNKMVPANMRTEYYNSVLIKAEKTPALFCGAKMYGKRKRIAVKINPRDRRQHGVE